MSITDIATTAPPATTTDPMARLADWVNAASQAHQLVVPLIDSAFVPENFKPRIAPNASDEEKVYARQVAIANGTSAVLLGLNLGLDPLTALQQIILIKNRPSMYAKAKVAILTSRGYDIWTQELTDEKAVICVVRPNTGGRVEEFMVTMDQAKKAGWTSNDNYAKTPQDMLYARAAGRACDRTGAHILLGIPTTEDVPDTIEVEASVGPRVTAAEVLGTIAQAPPEARPEPAEAEAGMTGPQQRKLYALLKEKGMTNRVATLDWMTGTLDRPEGQPVESTKTLTSREAGVVIDALERLPNAVAPAPDTAEPS